MSSELESVAALLRVTDRLRVLLTERAIWAPSDDGKIVLYKDNLVTRGQVVRLPAELVWSSAAFRSSPRKRSPLHVQMYVEVSESLSGGESTVCDRICYAGPDEGWCDATTSPVQPTPLDEEQAWLRIIAILDGFAARPSFGC